MGKDRSQRRFGPLFKTVYSFIAAILIAVSIEALLLMFKSAIDDGHQLYEAVLMMMSAVGLLVDLGVYVYLGAKVGATLTAMKTVQGVANPAVSHPVP